MAINQVWGIIQNIKRNKVITFGELSKPWSCDNDRLINDIRSAKKLQIEHMKKSTGESVFGYEYHF